MPKMFLLLGFSALVLSLKAQQTPLLRVHFDPNVYPISNWNYLRSEITFVDYVIDRHYCDVQVQPILEPVGNGAVRYRFFFFGYGVFAGQNDTISMETYPNENEGSIREKIVQRVKQGLLPYLLQTPLADAIDYKMGPESADNRRTEDPWGLRTFQPQLGFFAAGQRFKRGEYTQHNSNRRFNAGFDAWKISHKSRINSGLSYEYDGYASVVDTQRRAYHIQEWVFDLGYAHAIAQQWSLGGSIYTSFREHSQSSGDGNLYFAPTLGIEYSFFPYEQFFRERLTVAWFVGTSQSIAIASLDNNTVVVPISQGFTLNYAKIGRWGYCAGTLQASTRFQKNSTAFYMGFRPSVAINLGKNLFVSFSGNLQLDVSSQKSIFVLPTGPVATSRTTYNNLTYQTSLGLSYYFGSGYRSIVNPRMWGNSLAL